MLKSLVLLFLFCGVARCVEVIPTCKDVSVCFAIDESGSISAPEYTNEIQAVMEVANTLKKVGRFPAFGAVSFANRANTISPMTTSLSTFMARLRVDKPTGGSTGISYGLTLCADLLNGARDPKAIVLVTDGQNNVGQSPTSVASSLKVKGIDILTVGMGSGVSSSQLIAIASNPHFYTKAKGPDQLKNFIWSIVGDLCAVSGKTRCGRTQLDARKCFTPCNTPWDCPLGEKCYSGLSCDPNSLAAASLKEAEIVGDDPAQQNSSVPDIDCAMDENGACIEHENLEFVDRVDMTTLDSSATSCAEGGIGMC